MGKISLIMGIIIGMLFSVAFPEVAQTVNDAIMPTIQSISEQMINWITE
jgi:small basic protein|tara:strand:+ start:642 stop:788 length:147 start_codon:yes stop_codon:yes gene_type:complete